MIVFFLKKSISKKIIVFSPPHVEWLYLAVGNDSDITNVHRLKCRAKRGNMFGFCHFQRDTKYDMCKLVDLILTKQFELRKMVMTLLL